MGLSGDELAEFVRRSCEASGVAVFVTDAGVLGDVAVLLGAGNGRERPQGAPPVPARSESPVDLHPVVVEAPSRVGRGQDADPVDDGRDDGGLAGEVEVGPPAA